MKHLEKILPAFKEFMQLEGNKLTVYMQDGTAKDVGKNGVQASDLIFFIRELFASLNESVPCRENALTITHLDEAWHWQLRRDSDRLIRGVEGTQEK